ncbi:MAG TPA: glycosyltransferase family 39 protein [Blastocatellia bacterium]|nr:glycosyltransferase family 39 protein [Blastocatellia bacterium]
MRLAKRLIRERPALLAAGGHIAGFRSRAADLLGSGRAASARQKLVLASIIFFLSFSIKSLQAVDLAPLMYTSEQPMNGLTLFYDSRAASIVEGKGLLIPDDQSPADTGLLAFAPGYPLYLSAIYRSLGRNFFTVQLVQNATNSITPVLVFLLAGALVSWRVGAVAGSLSALSHHLSYYSNFILPDALSTLPIVAATYLIAKVWEEDRQGSEASARRAYLYYGVAGVLLAAAAWLRPNAMMLAPFMMLMLVAISERRWRQLRLGAVMLVVSVLAISPITIRNYIIYREFVPISINLGIVLWQGIGDAGGERFGAVTTDRAVGEQEIILYNNPRYGWWASPDGIQRDRDRVRRSLDVILANPLWFAGAVSWRIGEMLKYTAHAPLVFRSKDTSLADQMRNAPRTYLPDLDRRPEMTDSSSLAVGEGLAWMRPLARSLQRAAKETMPAFLFIGLALLLPLGWRNSLFILIVPFYNIFSQSPMHWEFRYTLAMHYYFFIFAAAVWVLIAVSIVRAARRLSRRAGI